MTNIDRQGVCIRNTKSTENNGPADCSKGYVAEKQGFRMAWLNCREMGQYSDFVRVCMSVSACVCVC